MPLVEKFVSDGADIRVLSIATFGYFILKIFSSSVGFSLKSRISIFENPVIGDFPTGVAFFSTFIFFGIKTPPISSRSEKYYFVSTSPTNLS